MSEQVKIILAVDPSQVESGAARASRALGDVEKAAQKAGTGTAAAGKQAADSQKQVGEAVKKSTVEMSASAKQAASTIAGTAAIVGTAALAGVGMAVKEFASFDAAMSGVASTGADAKAQIGQLRQAAIDAGSSTAFSATEAANGIEELARAGVSTADVLGGGLKGSLDLAAAGQLSVADSAAIASTAMTQFKLTGNDVSHVADLLAAGAGKAMGGVDDLGMALQQGGLVASQFGLSIEETVGGLAAFASAGLLGSDAGTSLKTMLLKLASPSKEAKTLMEQLGISAYDAQGKFVGLQSLAGQLQNAFAGQSDATRDAAMATIFGTDAIRAANVLYQNGADGIAKWTDAVNESGYAAETAATLQDNLVGDLEKLGGSWSTFSIAMGDSANGPLRGAVQSLTSLIDIMGETPGAAQGLLIGATAIGGISLAAAGLMKGAVLVSEFRGAMSTLTDTYPGLEKVSGAMGKVGKAAGIAAAAFVGWQLGVAAVNALSAKGPGLEVTAAALERIKQGTEGLGSLDSTFRSLNGGELVGGVESLNSALQQLANVSNNVNGSQIAYAMESFVMMGNGQMDKLATQFEQVDQAMSNLSMRDATQIFAGIRDQAFEAGLSMDELVRMFPEYAGQVQQLAAANGIGELSGNDLAMAMSGLYGPLTAAQEAMGETTTAAASQAGAYDEAAAAAEAQAEAQAAAADAAKDALDAYMAEVEAINSLNDAQREGANVTMNAERANADWIETLAAADEQIKKNGTSLDENTAKGRSNAEYLRTVAESARENTDAMLANGESVDVVNGKMETQRGQFIKTAGQFGVNSAAAEALADKYGLIPNYVQTVVATPGAKLSKKEADDLNRSLEDIDPETRAKIITIANTQGADAARAAIASVKSKTVTVTVNSVRTGLQSSVWGNDYAHGGIVEFYAAGGTPGMDRAGDVRNAHAPAIVPAGTNRMFAEEETGGEAYIPLRNDWRRSRAVSILGAVADRFGLSLVKDAQQFALGGLTNASYNAIRSYQTGTLPVAEFAKLNAELTRTAAIMRQTAGAAASTAKSQQQATAARVKADAALKAAKDNTSTSAVGKATAALKAARDTSSTSAVGKAQATLKAARAKPSRTRSQKAARARAVAAAEKAVDAAKKKQEANVKAAEKALENAKRQREINVAAAQKAVDKAKAAETKATAANKAAQDKAKDAAKAQEEAAKDVAAAHKQLADSARQAADQLRQTYMVGGDAADLLSSMQQGSGNLAAFAGLVEQLRKAGLNEDLVQQIIDQGEVWGAETAKDILKGGKPTVDALNKAAASLQAAADKLGLLTVVGQKQYADGGIEVHEAMIGTGIRRVWDEPETGGEAYIPLASSKRSTSIPIWQKTGELLGATRPTVALADGGILTSASFARPAAQQQSVTYNVRYDVRLPESIRDAAQMVAFFDQAPLNLHRSGV